MTDVIEALARAHYEKYVEEVADLEYRWRDPTCDESYWHRMTEAMRAALSAALERGWKLVPVEPTEEMKNAPDDSGGNVGGFLDMYSSKLVWEYMIQSSPEVK